MRRSLVRSPSRNPVVTVAQALTITPVAVVVAVVVLVTLRTVVRAVRVALALEALRVLREPQTAVLVV
jgi:hypothetical protein